MNVEYVSVQKLHPHPRNKEFFRKMQGEDWERFCADIKANGIRDPLKVTKDFTIIGGEQRWMASQEVGLTEVPVVIQDLSPKEALQLLLMDNLNRRHLTPIEKAKVASVLKEEWSVKAGNNEHNNENGKSVDDIASAIGESKRTTQRLIKLNDLIPEFKDLVERGILKQTSAESLAHLEVEEQEALYKALGETIAEKTVQETKDLRKAVEAQRPDLEEGEEESSDDIQTRIASAISKQKEEYEQKLREEREKTENAMNMVTRLETELEALSANTDDDSRQEELERHLSQMSQQLFEAEERAKTAEIQMKELQATGGAESNLDTVRLGMWKQVTALVKNLVKEDTVNGDIFEEIERIADTLTYYVEKMKKG